MMLKIATYFLLVAIAKRQNIFYSLLPPPAPSAPPALITSFKDVL